MPDKSFYDGLSLAEQLTKFNEHHHDPLTRHTSKFESAMLDKIADIMSSPASASARSTSDGGTRIALLGGGVLVLGAAAALLVRQRLDQKRKQGSGGDGDSSTAVESPPSEPNADASSTPPAPAESTTSTDPDERLNPLNLDGSSPPELDPLRDAESGDEPR